MKNEAQKKKKLLKIRKIRKRSNLKEIQHWIKEIIRKENEVVIHLKVKHQNQVVKVGQRKIRVKLGNGAHHHQNLYHHRDHHHDHHHNLDQILERNGKRTKSIKLS